MSESSIDVAGPEGRQAAAALVGEFRERPWELLEDEQLMRFRSLGEGAVDALIEVLAKGTESHYVRHNVAKVLARVGGARVAGPLIEALRDSDEVVRAGAAGALDGVDEAGRKELAEPLIGPLIEALRDPSVVVRGAAWTLCAIKDQRTAGPLLEVLQDPALDTYPNNRFGWLLRPQLELTLERMGARRRPSGPEELEGPARAVALALKAWWRERAVAWWRTSDRKGAICDDGNEDLGLGEGYLQASSLVCERCADLGLGHADWSAALSDVDGWFGPNVPRHIIDLARHSAA